MPGICGMLNLIAVVIGYLLGSIPSAYIMAKLRKGVDIREVGTGNMGAANVIRQVGIWEGSIVMVVDISKGAVAILVAQTLNVSQTWLLGAGFAALLGHNFPIYIGFRGGKGAATAIGIFLPLAPGEMCVVFGIIAISFLIIRSIHKVPFVIGPGLGIGLAFVPLLIWLFQESVVLTFYSLALVIFIGLRTLPKRSQ